MVTTANIIRDTLFYIKNFLITQNIDPISNRPSGEQFIMTSYPARETTFPLITLKDTNSFNNGALGLQSEAAEHFIDIEIRIWAKDVATRDKLSDQIYQLLKDNQIGTSGTSQAVDLHDLTLVASVNVDESTVKSKVMTWRFMFIAT